MEQRINRVNEAVQQWNRSEREHGQLYPEILGSPAFARTRLKELHIIQARFKNSTDPVEQKSLQFLKMESSRLQKIALKSKYNWRYILFHLFSPIRYNLTAAKLNRVEKQRSENFIQSIESSAFRQYTHEIKNLIQQGKKDFTYSASLQKENETTDLKLNIGYDEHRGHYFKDCKATYVNKMNPEVVRHHQMSILPGGPDPDLIANLMAGRPVYDNQHGWRQLDFTDKDTQGSFKMKNLLSPGFDIDKSCEKLPFWDKLKMSDQLITVQLLLQGNRQPVNFEHLGVKHTVFVEASPSKQEILVFNDKGKPVDLKKLLSLESPKAGESIMTVVKSPNQAISQLTKSVEAAKSTKDLNKIRANETVNVEFKERRSFKHRKTQNL